MKRVLVTGASGNVGQEVVRAVLARNVEVVAADFRGERVGFARSNGVDHVAFLSVAGAFSVCDRIFGTYREA